MKKPLILFVAAMLLSSLFVCAHAEVDAPFSFNIKKTDWSRIGNQNGEVIGTVSSSMDPFDHYEFEIRCEEDPDIFISFNNLLAQSGNIVCTTWEGGHHDLYNGYHYVLTIKAFDVPYYDAKPVATDSYSFVGTGIKAPVYSNITLTNVSLKPNKLLVNGYDINGTTFDVTFSAPVSKVKPWWAEGFDGAKDFTAQKKDDEGLVWTISMPEEVLDEEGSINVMITAWDLKDVQVKGEDGDHAFALNLIVTGGSEGDDEDENDYIPEDGYTTMKLGENAFAGLKPAYGLYVAESDGTVLVEMQELMQVSYNGQEREYSYVPGSDYAYRVEIDNVKTGGKIAIKSDFIWNTLSKVKISVFQGDGAVPVEIKAVIPAQDKEFDWNSTGLITLNFNKNVMIESIKFVAGDYSCDVDDVHLSSSVGFNISKALNDAINDGKIKAGEKFQIKISGLCDAADEKNLYNGDGNLTLEYIAPSAQHKFVRATVGENQLSYTQANTYNFLSYYAKDAEDGLFEFEFDGEVGKVSDVYMSMGNLDLDASGKYHRSTLPFTIEGNKIIVDARGTLRTLAVLFPAVIEEEAGEGEEVISGIGSYDTEHVTITLSNVLDKNGNAFLSDNSGSIGSYSFVMGYKEIVDEAYIDGDNKADGENVNGLETISLWLSNPDIKFEGIEVSYFVPVENGGDELDESQELKTEIVKDFTSVPDGLEGVIISFKMPVMENAVEGSKVRVSLHNASSSDGMPHYLYIEFKATGETNAITSVSKVAENADIYTLSGVKVNKDAAHKGVFIVNGKAMLLK